MHKCILNESCATHRCTRDMGTRMNKVSRVNQLGMSQMPRVDILVQGGKDP